MPTASDYHQFATGFDAEAERLFATADSLRRDPPSAGLGGWVTTTTVTARTTAIVRLGDEAARHCSALADECRRRAVVCRSYTEAYQRYLRDLAAHGLLVRNAEPGEWVGWRPSPPARPAPWVERG